MARVWESVGQKRKSAGAIWCFMRLREDINGVDPVGWHFFPSHSILQTIWGGLRAKQVEEKEGEVKMERLNLLIHTHIYIDIYILLALASLLRCLCAIMHRHKEEEEEEGGGGGGGGRCILSITVIAVPSCARALSHSSSKEKKGDE